MHFLKHTIKTCIVDLHLVAKEPKDKERVITSLNLALVTSVTKLMGDV